MSHVVSTTIGQLSARDIGETVRVQDEQSTHEGTLRTVTHFTLSLSGHQTTVVLRDGSWNHVNTYPSDHPVHVIGRSQ